MVPQKSMEQELKSQEKELTEEINSLGKKVGLAMCLRVISLLMPRTRSQNTWKSSLMMPRLNSGTS